jgi:hypothetical protein
MKKSIVIALLAVFFYNLVGFMAAFRFIRSEWRHAVWAELAERKDHDLTTTFYFSTQNFDPTEHEFSINGHYYDVITIEKHDVDSLKVVCFNDEKETELVAYFNDDLLKQVNQKSDNHGKSTVLFDFLVKDYLFENAFSFQIPPSVFEPFLARFSFQNLFLKTPFLETISPPPQV